MKSEKYINKVSLLEQILRSGKNYLFAIALATIAFSCEAWNIENQKDSIGLLEKNKKLYYGKDELTTQKGENLRDSLYNCEKIIQYAWDKRNYEFDDFIAHIEERISGQDLDKSPALQNGLMILLLAWDSFDDEGIMLSNRKAGQWIKAIAGIFEFTPAKTLKHDIKWYLNNEKWLARRWIKNAWKDANDTNKHENATKKSDRMVCYTAESYRNLKKHHQKLELKKLHIALNFSEWQKFSQQEQEELRKAKNNAAEFRITLTMKDFNDLYDGNKKFTIPKDVTYIKPLVWNRIRNLKLTKFEIAKDGSNFEEFKNAKYELKDKLIASIDGQDVDIEVYRDDFGNLCCKCSYDNYINIPLEYSSIREKLDIYFESCNDLIKTVSNGKETNGKQSKPKDIIELIEKFKKKHGCKGVKARLTKGDIDIYIDKNDSSIMIPEYVIYIDNNALDEIKKLKNIYYEIDNNGSNFEEFKNAKYELKDKLIASIGRRNVDIKVLYRDNFGNLYCKCSYDTYVHIPPEYSSIRKKLDIYFESCNDLIKTVSKNQETNGKQLKPKDIIKLIEGFKKEHGCNGVKSRLTKGDIEFYKNGSSITIPEYVIYIDYDAFDGREDITEMTIENWGFLDSNERRQIGSIKSLRTVYISDWRDISDARRDLNNPNIKIKHIFEKPNE